MSTTGSLDNIYKELTELSYLSDNLHSLAYALDQVGNTSMADDLDHIAEVISKCKNNIRIETGNIINDMFKQSQESSVNIINAALAGMSIAREKKEDAQ